MSLIRKTRKELSLSTTQLAHRLGVQQSTLVRLEQSEERGAVTLNSLRKAADALGCELVYSFIHSKEQFRPKKPGRSEASRAGRRTSKLANELFSSEINLAKQLSAAQRIVRAMQLSDFARKMRRCSK